MLLRRSHTGSANRGRDGVNLYRPSDRHGSASATCGALGSWAVACPRDAEMFCTADHADGRGSDVRFSIRVHPPFICGHISLVAANGCLKGSWCCGKRKGSRSPVGWALQNSTFVVRSKLRATNDYIGEARWCQHAATRTGLAVWHRDEAPRDRGAVGPEACDAGNCETFPGFGCLV